MERGSARRYLRERSTRDGAPQAPAARSCHPREEHPIPLHVWFGAAGDDAASLPYRDLVIGGTHQRDALRLRLNWRSGSHAG